LLVSEIEGAWHAKAVGMAPCGSYVCFAFFALLREICFAQRTQRKLRKSKEPGMDKFVAAIVTVLLTVTTVPAQDWSQLYTRPAVPSGEALDRLNLVKSWHTYVPTAGKRDGLLSVQVFDDQVLVQTRSGGVTAIRMEDGTIEWNVPVGIPYRVAVFLGRNKDSVFAIHGTHLHALNRQTGALQWTFSLPYAASAPPVADDERLYLCLATGRFLVYELPKLPKMAASAKTPADKKDSAPSTAVDLTAATGATSQVDFTSAGVSGPADTNWLNRGPQPRMLWAYLGISRLEQAPLIAPETLLLAGADGTFFATSRDLRITKYRFKADAALAAPVGQYDETAYVASTEYDVYALDMLAGKITWRFVSGTPITRKPEVNDDDVYISPNRPNLARVDRLSGEKMWSNPKADRFLTANKKFVYALDASGQLLVLDRKHGTILSTLDTRDFVVPVTNELTDRLFLASNDGLLVCLHDREYRKPLIMKKIKAAPAPKSKAEAIIPKDKGEEKEKEK
jgi:outer membrane protein assembly factor BamB